MWISFVEECVMNPKYEGYRAGRIEVYEEDKPFASEEIRFFTKLSSFDLFREIHDFEDVDEDKLASIREFVESNYQEPI